MSDLPLKPLRLAHRVPNEDTLRGGSWRKCGLLHRVGSPDHHVLDARACLKLLLLLLLLLLRHLLLLLPLLLLQQIFEQKRLFLLGNLKQQLLSLKSRLARSHLIMRVLHFARG